MLVAELTERPILGGLSIKYHCITIVPYAIRFTNHLARNLVRLRSNQRCIGFWQTLALCTINLKIPRIR